MLPLRLPLLCAILACGCAVSTIDRPSEEDGTDAGPLLEDASTPSVDAGAIDPSDAGEADSTDSGAIDASTPDASSTGPDASFDYAGPASTLAATPGSTTDDETGDLTTDPVKDYTLVGRSAAADRAALEDVIIARPSARATPDHAPRWKPTYADEFNGPPAGADPTCYTRAPQCMYVSGWGHRDCPAATHAQLAGLDKCTWSIYASYNWMDQGAPAQHKINAFDPSEVRVQDGTLVLTASQRTRAQVDCGRKFTDPSIGGFENQTTDCPIVSGAIMSQRFGQWDPALPPLMKGFLQQYGRFEVRAKLPKGPGSWPAHWLLPQDYGVGWPYSGEIDIMELWSDKPRRVWGTLHDGDEASRNGFNEGHKWRSEGPYYTQDGRNDTWFNDFHTYSVEWDPWEIRFYVDRWHSGTTAEGKLIRHRRSGNDYPIDVPDSPFYVILNSTIAPFRDSWFWQRPDPEDFDRQTHVIDHVRAWRTCEGPDEYCPQGGTWNGTDCDHGEVAAAAHAWVEGGAVRYQATRGCPHGGRIGADGTCELGSYPDDAQPAISGGHLHTQAVCRENTLSPICRNPCGGNGLLENDGCFLGETRDGFKGDVKNGKLYYFTRSIFTATEASDCLPGHAFEPGEGCVFGTVPAGRTGTVANDGGVAKFYLNHLCAPHAAVPNCATPCPAGGRYDGTGCFLRTAPQGTNGFVYENGLYYSRLTTDPETACPAGGSWDGANCHLGAAPAGAPVFLAGDRFYLRAACGAVPF